MKKLKRSHAGFSLVEVTLALGVAAFCLVAVFGLLPVGINSNETSVEQTAASSAASSVVADLRAAPVGASTSLRFGIPLPTSPGNPPMYTLFLREDGSLATAAGTGAAAAPGSNADLTQDPRYRVTLLFPAPSPAPAASPAQRNATGVRILVTWPAAADSQATNPPTHFAGSFETITALARN